MIGRMRHGPRTLRAPVGHRVVAAVASPLVGYFVARLILELVKELKVRIVQVGAFGDIEARKREPMPELENDGEFGGEEPVRHDG